MIWAPPHHTMTADLLSRLLHAFALFAITYLFIPSAATGVGVGWSSHAVQTFKLLVAGRHPLTHFSRLPIVRTIGNLPRNPNRRNAIQVRFHGSSARPVIIARMRAHHHQHAQVLALRQAPIHGQKGPTPASTSSIASAQHCHSYSIHARARMCMLFMPPMCMSGTGNPPPSLSFLFSLPDPLLPPFFPLSYFCLPLSLPQLRVFSPPLSSCIRDTLTLAPYFFLSFPLFLRHHSARNPPPASTWKRRCRLLRAARLSA